MMGELEERAAKYAAENFEEILKGAIARVYADGYRDGYYDCKDGRPYGSSEEDDN